MAPSSSSDKPPRPLPQPVENTKRVMRRFAPDPVETTARSNRPPQSSPDDHLHSPRRVLPQPVESSSRSSKTSSRHNDDPSDAVAPAATSNVTTHGPSSLPQPIESTTSSSKSRKFMPQLVGTTSRRRSRGDTLPTVLDEDKTEHSPDNPIYLPRHLRGSRPGVLPVPPANSPTVSSAQVPQLPESKYSYASLSKRTSFDKPERGHSFLSPDLPSIPSQREESEESDDSTCPSLSTTPSAQSEETELRKHASKGQGEDTSGDLLALAAQAAQKQLREQAMAAYPNERIHEYVDHFAVDREDGGEEGVGLLSRSATYPPPTGSESVPSVSRRESHAGWDAADARKHTKNLERHKKDNKEKKHSMAGNLKKSVKDTDKEHHHGHHHHHQHENYYQHHHHKVQTPQSKPSAAHDNLHGGGHQKDGQIKPTQKPESPPMAGQNLTFPKCKSPRQTRLDVGQHPGVSLHIGTLKTRDHSGLWTPHGDPSRQNSKSGLWMGVCGASAVSATPAIFQTGLLTPAVERDDPFASTTAQTSKQSQQQLQQNTNLLLPPSPPNPTNIDTSIDSICRPKEDETLAQQQKAIEDEFHDGFITQVYNYLSLGYPSLARKYDDELSKITRIPIEDLRRDDGNTNAKGYVGAPEGNGCDMRGVKDGSCERWTALRLYIFEWAKQQPKMRGREGGANEEWGARARKGSWAL
ncbi:MAG: hypothetical protein Q9168_007390 [Polycauliona sp. 1 TL-2023]